MSIFKESFRKYVKQQLELRQAIISLGNDGGSRFNSRTLTFSKAAGGKKPPVKLSVHPIVRKAAMAAK